MQNKKIQRMMKDDVTRRNFLTASAAGTAAGFAAIADPGTAAAQSVGVKKSDLPDLTIKQVKVYVADLGSIRKLNTPESGEIVAIVTNSGIEGNYTLGNRERTTGWLEWAKATLPGKNVVDVLPTLNATSGMKSAAGFNARARIGGGAGLRPDGERAGAGNFVSIPSRSGGSWPNYKAAAADICLWDILGKAVDRPIFKLLGGTKDSSSEAESGGAHNTGGPAVVDSHAGASSPTPWLTASTPMVARPKRAIEPISRIMFRTRPITATTPANR